MCIRDRAFCEKAFAGNVAVSQIHVAQMVHDTAIDLLRNPLVETTVTGFHVEDRDVSSLGGDGA